MVSSAPTRFRLALLGVVVASLFLALFARLWFLQVLSAGDFQVAAQVNAVRSVSEPAPRGRILDRDGEVLVDNRASNVVAVDVSQLDGRDRRRVLDRLAPVLEVPVATLAARVEDPRADPLVPVPVGTNVSDDVIAHLRERQDDFPGIVARRATVRHYPHGELAAHVLGYVGEINDEELAERRGRRSGDRIGKSGVERIYEDDLRGVDGEVRLEVDANGRPVRVVDERPAVPGDDVVLALDLEVQRVAEAALAEGLAAARQRPFSDTGELLEGDGGAVVVLDVRDGSVVAMASYPTFDPRGLVHRVSPEQAARLFGEATNAPFTNRATQGLYAPGSTWKPVTALAALRAGLVDDATTVVDAGTYTIPGCRRDCTRRNAGGTAYGVVDLRRAMAVSSDVYFYDIGARFWERRAELGETAIQDEARRLGVGATTGLEGGGERAGHLATPASRRARHEENPSAYPEGNWFVGANVNLAIGQGELTVTPLQLANLYAALATGERHAPGLGRRVERWRDGEHRVVREVDPRPAEPVDLPGVLRAPVLDGLRRVVGAGEGTAAAAFADWPHDELPVAGKTGTAQAGVDQDTALFAAVAPADEPRYAVSVIMEQSGFGATAAAPVARRVLDQLLLADAP